VGVALVTGPELSRQVGDLVADLPGYLELLRGVLANVLPAGMEPRELVPDPATLAGQIRAGLSATLSTAATLAGGLVIVVAGFFVAMQPGRYMQGVLKLVPPARREEVEGVAMGLRRGLE